MGKIIEKVRKQREAAGKRSAQRYANDFWLALYEHQKAEKDRALVVPMLIASEPAKPDPWWRFWA